MCINKVLIDRILLFCAYGPPFFSFAINNLSSFVFQFSPMNVHKIIVSTLVFVVLRMSTMTSYAREYSYYHECNICVTCPLYRLDLIEI